VSVRPLTHWPADGRINADANVGFGFGLRFLAMLASPAPSAVARAERFRNGEARNGEGAKPPGQEKPYVTLPVNAVTVPPLEAEALVAATADSSTTAIAAAHIRLASQTAWLRRRCEPEALAKPLGREGCRPLQNGPDTRSELDTTTPLTDPGPEVRVVETSVASNETGAENHPQ